MSKVANLDLLSENSLVVLSKLPSWPIRWGIAIVSGLLAVVLIMSAVIPFPETVETSIQLQNSSELINIYPNTNSYLKSILVNEGDSVKAGQPLAEVQVNANEEGISQLKTYLQVIDSTPFDTLLIIKSLESLDSMMELQDDLQLLISKLKVRHELLAAQLEMRSHEYFENKHDQLRKLIDLSREELTLKRQEKNIAWDRFQTEKSLYLDSVIALKEFRIASEAFLRISTNYLALRKSLENQELQLLEFERSQTEQLQSTEQELFELNLQINEISKRLKSKLQEIEKNRYLIAQQAGRLHLYSRAKTGNLISRSEPLFAIEELAGEVVGTAKVKADQISKLQVGQAALIELDAYSKSDFKSLLAEVIEIGELLEEEQYEVKLRLVKKDSKALPFKAEMRGKVTVVCESKTLLERVFLEKVKLFD
jgi:multidrug efflux pump subunit AcrA (membrane-fusion protein)